MIMSFSEAFELKAVTGTADTAEKMRCLGQASPSQLELTMVCNSAGQTVLGHRYMAYPLSVSPIFRLEANAQAESQKRAYLYRMNTSPGLLAGDVWQTSIRLEAGAQLHLADQSATKVHTMPDGAQAMVTYGLEMGDRAELEFLPEPLILFAQAALRQQTNIVMHPTAGLLWGEIVVPGRLARGERYEFDSYFSRLCVRSVGGELWFVDAMKLLGKENRFVQSHLFASGDVLGTMLVILPEALATAAVLSSLSEEIESDRGSAVELACSVLPRGNGLWVRAITHKTRDLQACFRAITNAVRRLKGSLPLPDGL
jgi:urease accessory protein